MKLSIAATTAFFLAQSLGCATDGTTVGDVDADNNTDKPDAASSGTIDGDHENQADAAAAAGNNAAAAVIPYGGLSSGAIDGRVNIFVLDARDGKPIANASVQVGSLTKATDNDGLAIFIDRSLSGPQTITASASGFLTASWFGANAANATMLLEPEVPSSGTPTVPSAEVQGTIKGFDQLTPPQQNHWTIAYVGYSWSKTGGAENGITTPATSQSEPPPNMCVLNYSACNWKVKTRTGKLAIFATIMDHDTKGTQDASDDVYTMTGYAYRFGLELTEGQVLKGVELEMLPDNGLTNLNITRGSVPSGMDTVQIRTYMDVKDDGMLILPYPMTAPTSFSYRAPALTGAFGSFSYLGVEASAYKRPATQQEQVTAFSGLQKKISTPDSSVSLGDFLPAPANIDLKSGTLTFAPAAGANFHMITLSDDTTKARLWNAILISGQSSIAVPSAVKLPSKVSVLVGAYDVPQFAPTGFSFSLFQDVTRSATNYKVFTF
ncbi:MAG: hypothetical protein V2A73_06570 [Pseudomonadota bacterium]